MAVRLRLKRIGTNKRPIFRIVVADVRTPRDGRVIESIGVYNPLQKSAALTLDEEKALSWLQRGARPTATGRGRENDDAQAQGGPSGFGAGDRKAGTDREGDADASSRDSGQVSATGGACDRRAGRAVSRGL